MTNDDQRPEPTHDPDATPTGARRGYVRTMTMLMAIAVAVVVLWWLVTRVILT